MKVIFKERLIHKHTVDYYYFNKGGDYRETQSISNIDDPFPRLYNSTDDDTFSFTPFPNKKTTPDTLVDNNHLLNPNNSLEVSTYQHPPFVTLVIVLYKVYKYLYI